MFLLTNNKLFSNNVKFKLKKKETNKAKKKYLKKMKEKLRKIQN
jgi:hypothetical protein